MTLLHREELRVHVRRVVLRFGGGLDGPAPAVVGVVPEAHLRRRAALLRGPARSRREGPQLSVARSVFWGVSQGVRSVF